VVGIRLDDGDRLLNGEEVEDLLLGVILRVGAMKLVDGHAFDRKLCPQTAPTATGNGSDRRHRSCLLAPLQITLSVLTVKSLGMPNVPFPRFPLGIS